MIQSGEGDWIITATFVNRFQIPSSPAALQRKPVPEGEKVLYLAVSAAK
jgi:hypothetical protein